MPRWMSIAIAVLVMGGCAGGAPTVVVTPSRTVCPAAPLNATCPAFPPRPETADAFRAAWHRAAGAVECRDAALVAWRRLYKDCHGHGSAE